jgi:hypothetical protein
VESTSSAAAGLIAPAGVGFGIDEPERHAEPGMLARLAGEGLAALHRLPTTSAIPGTDGAPADAGDSAVAAASFPADQAQPGAEQAWRSVIERCRRAVADGSVVAAELAEPYRRYQPAELLDMVTGSSVGWSDDDGPVWCHGLPSAEAFRIEGGRFVGFADFDRAVVADRHLDLAIAHWGIDRVLGAEAVYGLYEGYGQDPDLLRLDHYLLVANLLGLIRDPAGRAQS